MGISAGVGAVAAAGVIMAGAVAAAASASHAGSIELSGGAAGLSGRYNMASPVPNHPGFYRTNIQGGLYVGGRNHGYAMARSDGYAWVTLAGFDGPGRRNINKYISAGDVRHPGSITVKVCQSALGPDKCGSQSYNW